MTHLETYLDCLKLLPGDLARDMSLMSTLDQQLLHLQSTLRSQQQQLIDLVSRRHTPDLPLPPPPPPSTSTSTPSTLPSSSLPTWLSLLSSVRRLEWEVECVCEEKVALSLQVKEGLLSYSRRLEDETALSEKEMGPDAIREAMDAGERGRSGKSSFGIRAAATGKAAGKGGGGGGGAGLKEKDRGWREREKERDRERERMKAQQAAAEDDGDEDDDLRMDSLEEGGEEEEKMQGGGGGGGGLSEASELGEGGEDGEGDDGGGSFGYPAGSGVISSNDPVFCFCRTPSYGDMVACDDPSCRFEWFHYACVGLKKPPKGEWFCQECRTRNNHNSNATAQWKSGR